MRAARAAGLPIVIGFTVETDGRLPNGDSIEEAILAVDDATDGAAECFIINCAHPTHFADACRKAKPECVSMDYGRTRRGSATQSSTRPKELDSGDPADLAERYVTLRRDLPGSNSLAAAAAPTSVT